MSERLESSVNKGRMKRGQADLIRHNARAIQSLPRGKFHTSEVVRDGASDVEVPYADLPDTIKRRQGRGVLLKAERRYFGSSTYFIWRIPDKIHDYAEQYLEQLDTAIPGCPHTGVRNISGGGYTCCNDECDNEVPRSEVSNT